MLVGVLLIVFPPRMALAHTDGAIQLTSAPAGPYKVTVWTWPDPPRVGDIHISIALVLAEDASPVLDAKVIIEVRSLSGDVTLSAPSTTENSENKFLYESAMDFPDSGIYTVTINVGGSDEAEVAFQMEVLPERAFNPLLLLPIIIVIIGIIIWLIRKKRRVVR